MILSNAGRVWLASLMLVLLVGMAGCSRDSAVSTEYGRVRGQSGGKSLNGVTVLADMFRRNGHSVSRHSKLSPRIDRFQTLVWFPDESDCPSDAVVERLETWLSAGYDRTLIYVGRDFSGELDYYRQLVEQSDGTQRERASRALAEAQLRQDTHQRQEHWNKWSTVADVDECLWFEKETSQRKAGRRFDGILTTTLGPNEKPAIETSTHMVPRVEYTDSRPHRDMEVLMRVDSEPFVFAYRDNDEAYVNGSWSSDNQILFVSNGSFLLNYGLIEPANQKLARQLIEQCEPGEDVLFLESGPGDIQVSSSDSDGHNQWSWITKRPLCYMVPHFMVWGVLFCFTYYPIFGRPRRIPSDQYRSFGDHIAALGKLMSRQGDLEKRRSEVQEFQQTSAQEAFRGQNKQPSNPSKRKNS